MPDETVAVNPKFLFGTYNGFLANMLTSKSPVNPDMCELELAFHDLKSLKLPLKFARPSKAILPRLENTPPYLAAGIAFHAKKSHETVPELQYHGVRTAFLPGP